jgi:hypothetical protein
MMSTLFARKASDEDPQILPFDDFYIAVAAILLILSSSSPNQAAELLDVRATVNFGTSAWLVRNTGLFGRP